MKQAVRRTRMEGQAGDQFATTFSTVPASFTYHVELAGRRSPDYTVTLLTNPRVKRIDLSYDFPSFTKLASRTENDGGDIYAPAGTDVRVQVFTDRPAASGEIALGGGKPLALVSTAANELSASLTVASSDAIKQLFLEFQAAGVAFNQPLKREPWGAKDFIVQDPDGNLLLFAGPAE